MSKRTAKAIWFPSWYELDQTIEVGQTADFHFFVNVPEQLRDGNPVRPSFAEQKSFRFETPILERFIELTR